MHHERLRDEETVLQGQWLEIVDGPVPGAVPGPVPDAVDLRIRWLVANALDAIGSSDGGWDWLFRDPRDARLWELTFPQGSLHGSGPRRLALIPYEEAAEKYALRRSSGLVDTPEATS